MGTEVPRRSSGIYLGPLGSRASLPTPSLCLLIKRLMRAPQILGSPRCQPRAVRSPPAPSQGRTKGVSPPLPVPSLEESSPLGENQHFTRVSSVFFTVLSKQMVQLMNMKLQQEEKPPDQSRCDLCGSAEAVTAAATNAGGQHPGVVQSCKHQPGPWPCAETGRNDGC